MLCGQDRESVTRRTDDERIPYDSTAGRRSIFFWRVSRREEHTPWRRLLFDRWHSDNFLLFRSGHARKSLSKLRKRSGKSRMMSLFSRLGCGCLVWLQCRFPSLPCLVVFFIPQFSLLHQPEQLDHDFCDSLLARSTCFEMLHPMHAGYLSSLVY